MCRRSGGLALVAVALALGLGCGSRVDLDVAGVGPREPATEPAGAPAVVDPCSRAAPPGADSGWPLERATPGRTARSPFEGPAPDDDAELVVAAPLPAAATRAVLASDGGPVVGVGSAGVMAFAPDGGARWTERATAAVVVAPAIDGGVVVTLANDGVLDGRDAGTGALLWRHRSPAHRSKHAPLVTADHVVLVAASDALAAVGAADGADVATFPELAALRATPAASADEPGLLSFVDAQGFARGVLAPAGAGRPVWSTALPRELSDTESPASTAAAPGGRVYVVTSAHVSAIDVVGGATAVLRWSWSSDLVSNLSAPAVDADGGARWVDGKTAMLYGASRDGVLRFATPLVDAPTSALVVSDPVVDARGRTYVTGGSHVYGFDADGTRLFAIDLRGLATGVVVGPGRTLWITGQRLWAVQPARCRR